MHNDQHLIEALRTNDPRGIGKIYDLYAQQARRWVVSRNGSVDDARDVFQEALMVVYEKALDPGFKLTCPLGALLFVLYSRKWVDKIRQKNRESLAKLYQMFQASGGSSQAAELAPHSLVMRVSLRSKPQVPRARPDQVVSWRDLGWDWRCGSSSMRNTNSSQTSIQRAQRMQSALAIAGERPCGAPYSAGAITCGSGQTRKQSPQAVQRSRFTALTCISAPRPSTP